MPAAPAMSWSLTEAPQYWVSNQLVKTTLGYRRPRLCELGRRMACGLVAARVDRHAKFLPHNRIGEIRKRIRIDTDAILEPLAHAH
jgi:hypothetical protein